MTADNIVMKIFLLPVILLALTVHEYAHGYVAYLRGDGTAKAMGRLTFNPIPHIDILGLVFLIFFNFGWAKPVPINPANFKSPKKDEILVSLAGIGANLALALILGIIYRFINFSIFGDLASVINTYILMAVVINCGLAVFNLIPIPPLDGSHVLRELLPYEAAVKYVRFFSNPMIMLGVLAVFFFLPGVLSSLITVPLYFLANLFTGGALR